MLGAVAAVAVLLTSAAANDAALLPSPAAPASGAAVRAAVAPNAPSAAVEVLPSSSADVAPPPAAEPTAAPAPTTTDDAALAAEAADDAADDEAGPDDAELDANRAVDPLAAPGVRYTAELSDAQLAERFEQEPEALGSISVGFCDAGRLINGVQMPPGDGWQVVAPDYAWATQETVEALMTAAQVVKGQYPNMLPLRVNHIGRKDGGYLRPHHSHQSGRDVDLGFYYEVGQDPGKLTKRRDLAMDLDANWLLIKSLATLSDVEVILVDKKIQKRLYEHAVKKGEDLAWLELLFHSGRASLLQHARRHRDHFHVRFFSGRSQELGRRVQPILARRPEQNLAIHRVKKGDTLGHIASRYGSTVRLIQKANHMNTTMLRLGRTLVIPLRGPCNKCPLPPPVDVPPRRLPPGFEAPAAAPSET